MSDEPTLPPGYPEDLVRDVTLLDGRQVRLRPVRPEDRDELRHAVETADPETLRLRFLGGRPPLHDEDYERLVRVDYDRRLAVAAFAPEGPGVGIARYEAVGDTDNAEVAVAVDPAWRHVGLATALVRLLAAGALTHGIHRFSAEFFADNLDISDLLAEAGVAYQTSQDAAGVVTVEVELPAEAAAQLGPQG